MRPDLLGNSAGEEDSSSIYRPVLGVILSLLIGGICRQIGKRRSIPFAAVLVYFGFAAGCLQNHMGGIGHALHTLIDLSPRAYVIIFFPMALFYQNIVIDPYIFQKEITNILILGVAGACLQPLCLALFLRYVLAYGELSFVRALLIGTIVTPTLTQSIVNILRVNGIPQKFSTLIQGQAFVLNGLSFFLFQYFDKLDKLELHSALSVAGYLIYNIIGGVVVGCLFGYAFSLWLRKISRDSLLSGLVTLAGLYGTMLFCSFSRLGTSRAITVLAFSQFFNSFGKSNLTKAQQAKLTKIIEFIYINLISVNFLILGINVGYYFVLQRE